MDRERYQRLEGIFARAVELRGETRRELLDRLCVGDAGLRRDVELLLARDTPEDPESEAPRQPLPARIGRYRITERIAEGGMGAVYLAEQDHPRRQVAVKIIHPGLVNEELLRRFRFEAELLGRLQHPGIAQIHEAGEADTEAGSQPYFAMEYIRGAELRTFVRQHALGIPERLELLARVCDAVNHAHQQGIVHRDLKPGNILVTQEPTGVSTGAGAKPSTRFAHLGQPKVLDFGVSCLERAGSRDGTRLTLPGRVLGTPAYMSPEQAGGERAVDTRSDVYSLGVIAFELLSGRLPHQLEDTPLVQALRIVQEQAAPRLETIDPALRGDLSIIVGKALETEPERRYASAAALADDIRRFLADQPITARPPTVRYQLSRFVRRNKIFVGGALVAVLGLMAGLVLALLSQREEARQRIMAEERAEEARHHAYATQLQAALALDASGDRGAARAQLEATRPELRAWELDFLTAALDDDLLRVPLSIPDLPVSLSTPGMDQVVFPIEPETLRRFDFTTGSWSDYPSPGPAEGRAVALLPGASHALWGDVQGRLLLLDLEGGAPPRELLKVEGPVNSVCVAAGGRLAALLVGRPAEPATATVYMLDLVSLRPWTIYPAAYYASPLAFSPDAARLALGTAELAGSEVLLLDVETGRQVRTLSGHENTVQALAFSHDGRLLASSSHDQTIRVWEVETGAERWTLAPLGSMAESLLFHPDGRRLLSGHADARIRTWNLETGQCTSTTSGRMAAQAADALIRQLVLDPSAELVQAVGSDGLRVRPLEVPVPEVLRHEHGKYPFASGVAFSPAGRLLATSGWDGTVRVWDAATRLPIVTLECPESALWLDFSPDGERLLVGGQLEYDEPVFRVWNTRTWTLEGELKGPIASDCGRFVPACGAVLVGFKTGLWVLDERTLERREERPTAGRVWSMARSPDGAAVAYGTSEGRFILLDAQSLVSRLEVQAHERGIKALAFSPDAKRLATGGEDEEIAVWRLPDGEELARFGSHGSGELLTLCFTPDGRRLLSGSRRDSIGIWEPETGHELLRLAGHDSYVVDLDFSPDGRVLASASGDNTIRLWDARPLRLRFEQRDRALAAEPVLIRR